MPGEARHPLDRPDLGGWMRVRQAVGPLLLFGILAGLAWMRLQGGGEPAWLRQATARAEEIRAAASLLAPGDSVTDPRAAAGALLLLAGVSPGTLLLLLRALGLGLGALGLLLVIRPPVCPGAGIRLSSLPGLLGSLPAYLLASSAYWVHASLEAEPCVAVGILFWLISRRQGPGWLLGIALAWALSWSPWAWVAVWPLAWGWLLGERSARSRAARVLLLGTLLVGAFAPELLRDPGGWLRGMLWEARAGGLASEMRPFGIETGLAPLWSTLHGPALLLVFAAARHWPARVRAGELSPLMALLVVTASLPAGFAHRSPLVLLLVWAAAEAGRGAAITWRRWPRRGWGLLLAMAAILPPLGAQALQTMARGSAEPPGEAAVAYLESRLPAGSLVAYDLGIAAPEPSRLHWIPIPFHSVAPEIHRGAYWAGWYRGCAAILVSERMVGRFLARADDYPDIIDFYVTLQQAAETQRAFGAEAGGRVRVLEQSAAGDGMPAEGWRARIARGPEGGLQGEFLARLGGALIRAARDAAGVALLEQARMAGYEELGIYLNLANGYMVQDRLLDAGRVLEAGLACHPAEPDLLYNLGLVLTRVGYWDRAVQTLGRLRTLRPHAAEIAYLLGVSLANAGRPGAARRALSEAEALAGDAEERTRIRAALEALGGDR